MDGYGTVRTAQSFAYEIRENSAVILRCFSRDGRAEIPEQIEGYPVTELGDYAFSPHFGEAQLEEELRDGKARLCIPETIQGATPPALCGERLEEIVLPRTLQRVGRYCFYNCGNLRRLEFYGGLEDWGSGAFTGCHRVRGLRVYADAEGRSHLKDVLDELREELEVEYLTDGASGASRLIFPEFYEEGVENTPARILENHVHGSGILYRNCFRGRAVDFAQYDALFPHAKAWESGEIVLRMALARLRFPQGLTRKAKEQYESYLKEHASDAGKWLLRQKDLEGLRFLLGESDRGHITAEEVRDDAVRQRGAQGQPEFRKSLTEELLGEATRLQYMEAVSFLMEYGRTKRPSGVSRRRRLEL